MNIRIESIYRKKISEYYNYSIIESNCGVKIRISTLV